MGRLGPKAFAGGFLCGLALTACAGASFPYHWYGLSAQSYEGTLLGPKPKDDLPFETCKPSPNPSAGPRSPCVVLPSSEFFRARTDYIECEQRLSDCEARCAP